MRIFTAMKEHYSIRFIEHSDCASVLDIYSWYVQNTVVSFEYEVPSNEEFLGRIKTHTGKYPWLVCERAGKIIGYAYACDFRFRTAYQWSPEVSIYLSHGEGGKGIGRILYTALFDILRLQGYFNVFGGLAIPNEASERLHRSTGFHEIGVFSNIGYKMGDWHGTKWLQLVLQQHVTNPPAPKPIDSVKNSTEVKGILDKANGKLAEIA
ncbi:MAG TPA: GNAT family N-acetyltransferase [Flavipsychrobacter sp.]|nr:GNAT family N-acetyltransferase [Flavipsychrobacter sp.]